MPVSNALFRHEVQLNTSASDKHKRNEALTRNQRVHGSSPCAPTIEIKDLRKSDSSLLPKKLGWEAHEKQKRDFSRCARAVSALSSDRCGTRALNRRNRLPSSRQRNWPSEQPIEALQLVLKCDLPRKMFDGQWR